MIAFPSLLPHVVVSPFRTKARLEAEIILLRPQLNVLRRAMAAPALALLWADQPEVAVFTAGHIPASTTLRSSWFSPTLSFVAGMTNGAAARKVAQLPA